MPGHLAEAAAIRLHGHVVGHLWSSHGTHRFQLTPEYRELHPRPVLGQIFEKEPRRQWKQAMHLPQWFSNLLPEGRLRDIIAEEHGVNPANEFRILMSVHTDLPGAIEILPEGHQRFGHRGLRAKGSDRPDGAERPGRYGSSYDGNGLIQFSLAGVHLKLSMTRHGAKFCLPERGELGDYLVKLPSRRFNLILENEYSMMTWAREVGINAPRCELRLSDDLGTLPHGFDTLEGTTFFVVKRFDRRRNTQERVEGVHMEDLNQVVHNWPWKKYEGVHYEGLGKIIRALCGEDDLLEYVRRLTFCIGIGNEDAHLKNWTIWYPDRNNPHLSPAYDLVSTIQYPELDRKMALKLGRTRDASRIDLAMMKRLAGNIDIDPARVTRTVEATLESMRESWPRISEDLPVGKSFWDRLRDYHGRCPSSDPS